MFEVHSSNKRRKKKRKKKRRRGEKGAQLVGQMGWKSMSAVSPLIEEAVRSPESGRAPPVIGIRPFSLLRDFHHDTIVCRPRSPPRDVPHSRRREPSPRETSRRVLNPAGRKWNSMWQHCSVTALISLSPGPSLSLSLFLFIYLSLCSFRSFSTR